MYANWYARLDNEETWMDEQGIEHVIARMSPRYARNILVWIERQHEGIVQAAANALRDVKLPPFDTHAYDDVVRSCDDEAAAMMSNPRAWLAETPLVLALTEAATPYIARHRQPKRHLRAVPLSAERYLHSV
ncbi:hypothetical protein [Nonomuraea sp. JJY05]|uniref:hypothetical protein n=1 Tax=Nonomuraea sp. JJY05 TaxID=3350255 RepID=UPI00373EAB70